LSQNPVWFSDCLSNELQQKWLCQFWDETFRRLSRVFVSAYWMLSFLEHFPSQRQLPCHKGLCGAVVANNLSKSSQSSSRFNWQPWEWDILGVSAQWNFQVTVVPGSIAGQWNFQVTVVPGSIAADLSHHMEHWEITKWLF
jgi:hypothetical protein